MLVTSVTKTLLGISFAAAIPGDNWPDLCWRTAVLPIPGARPLLVGLSSSEAGCTKLCAAMFQATTVDSSMINDALGELLNMTAGLLKTTMALDQPLGLPRIVNGQTPEFHEAQRRQVTVLRAQDLGLALWVREGQA